MLDPITAKNCAEEPSRFANIHYLLEPIWYTNRRVWKFVKHTSSGDQQYTYPTLRY